MAEMRRCYVCGRWVDARGPNSRRVVYSPDESSLTMCATCGDTEEELDPVAKALRNERSEDNGTS